MNCLCNWLAAVLFFVSFQLTRALERFEVKETPSSELSDRYPNLTITNQQVVEVNFQKKVIIMV